MTGPTMYEAMGGLPALTRLTKVFYDRVFADPLLAPVFVNFTENHRISVAVWLAEVFGGPPTFTEERGGHLHVLRAHHDLAITEEQRGRWVELMVESAREVFPPDEALMRSFTEYLNWGSTIAREVSQPGQPLVESAGAVPHWSWDGPAKGG
jgi:hemoglobin